MDEILYIKKLGFDDYEKIDILNFDNTDKNDIVGIKFKYGYFDINFSLYKELKEIYFYDDDDNFNINKSKIKSLDFSILKELKILHIENLNYLLTINISNNLNLEYLYLKCSKLELNKNPLVNLQKLTYLYLEIPNIYNLLFTCKKRLIILI